MNIIHSIIESLIRNISGGLGVRIRRFYYRKKFIHCGKDLRIDVGVVIEGAKFMSFGDQVWIDKNCILMAGVVELKADKEKKILNSDFNKNEGELYLGSFSHIAPNSILQAYGGIDIDKNFTCSADCKIYTLSNDPNKCKNGTYGSDDISYVKTSIVIKENVWLGLNSIVLGGTIEDNVFVQPNSVVVKSIESNSIAQGHPAKKVKNRF